MNDNQNPITDDEKDAPALGFLDESGSTPMWVKEDVKIEYDRDKNYVTCQTTHLSTFILAPAAIPTPTALALSGAALLVMGMRRR